MQKEINLRYCLANNIRMYREKMNLSREELRLKAIAELAGGGITEESLRFAKTLV